MGRIKNKPIFFLIIFLGIFGFAANSLAVNLNVNWPNSPFGTELRDDSITELIKYLYEWGFGIAGVSVFIVLLVAGIQYLTSAGNASKMGEAMSRIKSAILGLILLLASVLILNTINPQLTTLRTPTLDMATSTIDIYFSFLGGEPGDCSRTDFYAERDPFSVIFIAANGAATPIENITISEGEKNFESELEINSLEFLGSCFLILYPYNNFVSDGENPPIMISGIGPNAQKIKNINFLYGRNTFRSARLLDAGEIDDAAAFAETCTETTPACLYEKEGFDDSGLSLSMYATQNLAGKKMDNKTTSAGVKAGYAIILHKDDSFSGECSRIFSPGVGNLDSAGTQVRNRTASSVTLLSAASNQSVLSGSATLCEPMVPEGDCSSSPWFETINGDTATISADRRARRIELLPGYAALIFDKENYEGDCRVVTKSENFQGNTYLVNFFLAKRVSSVQIIRTELISPGSY